MGNQVKLATTGSLGARIQKDKETGGSHIEGFSLNPTVYRELGTLGLGTGMNEY